MRKALVIVDVQVDFCPGGALGVQDGDAVIALINAMARPGGYDLVLATRDWHPPDHGSFDTADPPGIWPVHCVRGTPGAELHPRLDQNVIDAVVDKGTGRDTEGYSGFDGTGLAERLRAAAVQQVTVVGLATEYCVKATALDALAEGFDVIVDPAATRAVEVAPGDGAGALAALEAAGARLC